MKNRIAGILIISIAALMGIIIFLFNRALTKIVETSCSHGTECPMWGTINFQTNIGILIMIFVILIGIFMLFFGREEKIVTVVKTVKESAQIEPEKITKENYQEIMGQLDDEEKLVLEKIIEAEGTIFQSDLVEKTSLNKVKVTRILDKLEGRGILERKRRGMTNVVILKHK